MKTRVISAIVALIILVPLIIVGGTAYNIGVYVIALLGLKEFLDIKFSKKPVPIFIQFMAYVFMTLVLLSNVNLITMDFELDFRLLSALFITFLLPVVLYHERKKYSINDAFYMIGGLLFLIISMTLLMLVRNMGLEILVYLLLITTMTDIFAYVTGSLIGKHKLLEVISPNKTWEGMVGGTIMGVFVSAVFYHTVIDPEFSKVYLLGISLFLSVLGQYGDLVFSSIKRYFGKKDFSNIMPGHGGILDRLDSIIFVLLGFVFFVNIL